MPTKSERVSGIEFAASFYKIPALMVYRVRCGKANCHCAKGAGHGPYAFLHWRDRSGRQCRRYVRQADTEEVREIIAERRAERQMQRYARMMAAIDRRAVLALCREFGQ